MSIHFCADGGTIEIVFRTIISVNQLSIYGAVSDLCDEYEASHARTGRLVLAGQSDPLFVPTSSLMKTPTPSTDAPAQEDLLQKYQARVDTLSQQNRVIKFCIDAGFLTTVGVGQYFMTKDTEEFSQFTESVARRTRKIGFDGTPKLGTYWKSQPATYEEKYGVEIRIASMNKDHFHSWVRISHGLNKLVTNLNNNKENDNNELETSEMQFDNFALKSNARAFVSRSKAKAKPLRRDSANSTTRTIPI